MKTKFFGVFWAMLAVIVLTGCDNDDDDIRVSDVPKEVMNTFDLKPYAYKLSQHNSSVVAYFL